jgi:hypothetical protein
MFVCCSGGCRFSRLGGRKQRLLDNRQIGQGEQGVELRGVFGQPAIAQLLMAKAVLDDVKGVLDPRFRGGRLQARTCASARSSGSARSRKAFGRALMMPRLTAIVLAET